MQSAAGASVGSREPVEFAPCIGGRPDFHGLWSSNFHQRPSSRKVSRGSETASGVLHLGVRAGIPTFGHVLDKMRIENLVVIVEKRL